MVRTDICDGGDRRQRWTFYSNGIVHFDNETCLTATTNGGLTAAPCAYSDPWQRWTVRLT